MSVNEYSSVTDAIDGLKRRGFVANFEFDGQTLEDVDQGTHYTAEQVKIIETHRFEGESDPDDMAIVYAFESADGRRGVLADAFGPYSEPGLGTFLKKVVLRMKV